MNSLRGILWFALLAISFLLWQAWMSDYVYRKAEPVAGPVATTPGDLPTPAGTTSSDLPTASAAAATPDGIQAVETPTSATVETKAPITVRTDTVVMRISPYGGTVLSVDLLNYRKDAKKAEPKIRLLDDQAETWFVAQSGLVASTGTAPNHQTLFESAQSEYTLADGADKLEVPMTWQDGSGLRVTKTLVFSRGSYVVTERLTIDNQAAAEFQGNAYHQLQRNAGPARSWSMTNPETYSFVGAAWFSEENKFEKLAFEDFAGEPLTRDITGGWAAMLQHYFFAAWIPAAGEPVKYETRVLTEAGREHYLIRALGPSFKVPAGQSAQREARFYAGPKLQNDLAAIAPGLPFVIDYGMVTVISEPLFWLLDKLHKLVGNWGMAIILVVVILKLLLYPLSEMQYRSMAKLRKLQPRIEALKQRYGEDRQKFNQAMLELYQKEKANPASGCLPLLLTIPVFIALYWVLLESVELRHAPFYGWIQNLSERDPYFILPILNAATMWATQKLSPAPVGMDPIQQKILMYMPLALSLTFAFFPAGLVLYWTVNGALGLLQQWIIMKRYAGNEAKTPAA
ncbi:MAG: membrane protein insertase YidC [Ahniella sp.]|nr:membrane protein insertase YidC [Ahniella sp.]